MHNILSHRQSVLTVKLVMGVLPYDLAWVVGRFEIFTKMRGSGLKLFGFGNKFLSEGK